MTRRHTVLATFRYTGLRLSELIGLRFDQIDLQARRISVVGKGRKPRVVPIPPVLAVELDAYLADLRPRSPHRSLSLPIQTRFPTGSFAAGTASMPSPPSSTTQVSGPQWPESTSRIGGDNNRRRASCVGEWTSTWCSGFSGTHASLPRPGTCTSPTPTSPCCGRGLLRLSAQVRSTPC